MTWMNEWEIQEAVDRFENHPVLGPAARTLENLMEAVNHNSDGWPYWRAPAKAAKRLMDLLTGDCTWNYRQHGVYKVTPDDVRVAYRTLKSFRTRTGLLFTIEEV